MQKDSAKLKQFGIKAFHKKQRPTNTSRYSKMSGFHEGSFRPEAARPAAALSLAQLLWHHGSASLQYFASQVSGGGLPGGCASPRPLAAFRELTGFSPSNLPEFSIGKIPVQPGKIPVIRGRRHYHRQGYKVHGFDCDQHQLKRCSFSVRLQTCNPLQCHGAVVIGKTASFQSS